MVIIADTRVYKEEVDTFVESAMTLKAAINDDTLITRDLAFEWFRSHRDEILSWAVDKTLHIKALKIIMSLSKFQHRKVVLRAMLAVSMSDDEFHPNEESLVSIAAAHWGLRVSDFAPQRR